MDEKPADWAFFRSQVPVCRQYAYFDNAAVAPLSTPAQTAILDWAKQAAEEGVRAWTQWAKQVEQVRRLAAGLIGAEAGEVAFVSNTTAGISLVAEGLDWRVGDNLVLPDNEFPSNQYAWLNLASRGVAARRVAVGDGPLDLNRLWESCDQRTRLIAISWVGYSTGWRVDLDELVRAAHDRGLLVLLDAIQGLGVFPLDVRNTPVDFVAADGHKWMLGPEGAGLLYVRRDLLDDLRPLNVGWNSVVHRHDYTHIELRLRRETARYEGGSQNMAGTLALGASLDLLQSLGLGPNASTIASRVLEIAAHARSRLQESGAVVLGGVEGNDAQRSGIVAFELPGRDLAAERTRLLQAGVVVNLRAGRLRISPHAYCTEEDVERLIVELDRSRP